MSATIKKRLGDALEVAQRLEKEQRLKDQRNNRNNLTVSPLQLSNEIDVKVGDENGIYTIAVNHDGSRVAVGLGTGCAQLFNTETWERIRKLRTGLASSLPLLAMKFYPCLTNNALYTGGSDGHIRAWNLNTFTQSESIYEAGNQITSIDFCNDGAYFATGGKDSCVRLYDSETLGLCCVHHGTSHLDVDSIEDDATIPGHSQKVFAIKFHPDDKNIFISAGWDHSLKVWDTRVDHAIRTIYGPFVCGDGLDISHNTILTASWLAQDALQLWDYSSGSLIKSVSFPSVDHKGEYLYCARFWDQQHVVAAGSGSNDLKVININSNRIDNTISGELHPVQAVEVMEKKNMIICGTSANLLRTATLC